MRVSACIYVCLRVFVRALFFVSVLGALYLIAISVLDVLKWTGPHVLLATEE